MAGQEVEDGVVEHLVAVACHHVAGTGHVGELGVGSAGQEVLGALSPAGRCCGPAPAAWEPVGRRRPGRGDRDRPPTSGSRRPSRIPPACPPGPSARPNGRRDGGAGSSPGPTGRSAAGGAVAGGDGVGRLSSRGESVEVAGHEGADALAARLLQLVGHVDEHDGTGRASLLGRLGDGHERGQPAERRAHQDGRSGQRRRAPGRPRRSRRGSSRRPAPGRCRRGPEGRPTTPASRPARARPMCRTTSAAPGRRRAAAPRSGCSRRGRPRRPPGAARPRTHGVRLGALAASGGHADIRSRYQP